MSKNKEDTYVNSASYRENAYKRVGLENLILFGVYLVTKQGETCTFERLVSECFENFPKMFSFKRYPEWPDSSKLGRPLRKLREKGFIVGTVKDHFVLTEFGKHLAQEIKKELESAKLSSTKFAKDRVAGTRSADDRIITYLTTNPIFEAFLKNPTACEISEQEFRSLLRCTLETPLRVIKQNLEYYKKIAQSYNEESLADFLSLCEKKFIKTKGK